MPFPRNKGKNTPADVAKGGDTATDLVSRAIDEAPKANEGAVATLEADAAAAAAQPETPAGNAPATGGAPPLRDSKGTLFDGAKHGTKKDGTPSYNKDGTFRNRRGSLGLTTTSGPIDPGDTTNIVASKRLAGWSCAMFFSTMVQTLGEHWKPEDEERKRIGDDVERAYIAWGIVDLPPGLALVMSIGLYAMPRAMDPRTQERVDSMLAKFRKPKPLAKPGIDPAKEKRE